MESRAEGPPEDAANEHGLPPTRGRGEGLDFQVESRLPRWAQIATRQYAIPEPGADAPPTALIGRCSQGGRVRSEAARRWRHGGRINGRWQEGQRREAAGSWRERRRGGRSKQGGERQEGRERAVVAWRGAWSGGVWWQSTVVCVCGLCVKCGVWLWGVGCQDCRCLVSRETCCARIRIGKIRGSNLKLDQVEVRAGAQISVGSDSLRRSGSSVLTA